MSPSPAFRHLLVVYGVVTITALALLGLAGLALLAILVGRAHAFVIIALLLGIAYFFLPFARGILRYPPDVAPSDGYHLALHEALPLWATVSKLAAEAGLPPVTSIVVSADTSVSVTYGHTGRTGHGLCAQLRIGLPILLSLDQPTGEVLIARAIGYPLPADRARERRRTIWAVVHMRHLAATLQSSGRAFAPAIQRAVERRITLLNEHGLSLQRESEQYGTGVRHTEGAHGTVRALLSHALLSSRVPTTTDDWVHYVRHSMQEPTPTPFRAILPHFNCPASPAEIRQLQTLATTSAEPQAAYWTELAEQLRTLGWDGTIPPGLGMTEQPFVLPASVDAAVTAFDHQCWQRIEGPCRNAWMAIVADREHVLSHPWIDAGKPVTADTIMALFRLGRRSEVLALATLHRGADRRGRVRYALACSLLHYGQRRTAHLMLDSLLYEADDIEVRYDVAEQLLALAPPGGHEASRYAAHLRHIMAQREEHRSQLAKLNTRSLWATPHIDIVMATDLLAALTSVPSITAAYLATCISGTMPVQEVHWLILMSNDRVDHTAITEPFSKLLHRRTANRVTVTTEHMLTSTDLTCIMSYYGNPWYVRQP